MALTPLKVYMAAYNGVQLALNFLVIAKILQLNIFGQGGELITNLGHFPVAGSYQVGAPIVRVILLMQLLEIVHSLVGITRGSPAVAMTQVGFKNFVYFGFMVAEPRIHDLRATGLMLIVWCLGDAARYPFYLLKELELSSYAATWLRYSAWIVLYPAGFVLEALVIHSNLDYLRQSGRMSLFMPNTLNFAFDMPSFIYFYLFVLIPIGGTSMLSYMKGQRQKVLGGSKAKSS